MTNHSEIVPPPCVVYPLGVLLQAPLSTLDERVEDADALSEALDSVRARILSFQRNLAAAEGTMVLVKKSSDERGEDSREGDASDYEMWDPAAIDPLRKGSFVRGNSLPDTFGYRNVSQPFATQFTRLRDWTDAPVASPIPTADLQDLIDTIDAWDEWSLDPDLPTSLCWGIRRTRDVLINFLNEAWLRTHQPDDPFTQRYAEARAQLNQAPHSLSNRLRALLTMLNVQAKTFSQHILKLAPNTLGSVLKGRYNIGPSTLKALQAVLPPTWQYFLFEGGSLPVDSEFVEAIQKKLPESGRIQSAARARQSLRDRMRDQLRARCEADLSVIGHRLGLLFLQTGLTQEAFGQRLGNIAHQYVHKLIHGERGISSEMRRRLALVLTPDAYRYLMEGGPFPAEGTRLLSGESADRVDRREFPGFSMERFNALQGSSGLERRDFNRQIKEILRSVLPEMSPSHVNNFYSHLQQRSAPDSTLFRLRHAFTPAAFAYLVGQRDELPPAPMILVDPQTSIHLLKLEKTFGLPDDWIARAKPTEPFPGSGILPEIDGSEDSVDSISSISNRILEFQGAVAQTESRPIPHLGHREALPDSFGSYEIPDELALGMKTAIEAMDDALAIDRLNQMASLDDLPIETRWSIRHTRDALINRFNEAWLRTHQPDDPFTQRYAAARAQLSQAPHSLSNRLLALLKLVNVSGRSFGTDVLEMGSRHINLILSGQRAMGARTSQALQLALSPGYQYFLFEGGSLPMDPDFCEAIREKFLASRRSVSLLRKQQALAVHRQEIRTECEPAPDKIGSRLGLLWLETDLTLREFGQLLGNTSIQHLRKLINGHHEISEIMERRLKIALTPEAYRYLVEGEGFPPEGISVLSGERPRRLAEMFSSFSEERFRKLQPYSGLKPSAFKREILRLMRIAFPEGPGNMRTFNLTLDGPITRYRLSKVFTPEAFAYLLCQRDDLPPADGIFVSL